MGFSFAFLSICVRCDRKLRIPQSVGISAQLAEAPILARGAPSAKGWAESKYPSQTNG